MAKGVNGLGLPTVSIGLLSIAMPPAQAAALMVMSALITNIWQMLSGPGLWRLVRRLWLMKLGVCFGGGSVQVALTEWVCPAFSIDEIRC